MIWLLRNEIEVVKAATTLSSHDLWAPMDQLLFLGPPLAAIH